MTFAFPIAFFALLAVPALVAIYWLRSRHRRQPVSTLMLWIDQRESREGGLFVHRLQTPLLFFLELLTILLLILAAAGPAITANAGSGSLVVVLDDSFSMLAGADDSSRIRAIDAVAKEVRGGRYRSVRLVVAGVTPELIGTEAGEIETTLRNEWKCLSSSANLDEAIAFAFALSVNRARILVVTDRAPNDAPSDGQLEWWAFGSSRRNLAFVNATRTLRDDQERCLLEIANLSGNMAKTDLIIEGGGSDDQSQELQRSSIEIAPNGIHRILLRIKPSVVQLRAHIDDDDLDIDNRVVLVPEPRRHVRVDLRFQSDELKRLVEKAVSATGSIDLTSTDPELVFTDQVEDEAGSPDAWVLRFVADGDAQSYLGPFVLDRTHPLAEGLALDGVVWGAGKASSPSTTAVITAGSIPLLTDVERPGGRHDLRLRLRPDLSTLQETPNWPILIWNLIAWRAANAPGIRQANLRLGDEAILTVGPGSRSVEIRSPDGTASDLALQSRDTRLRAELPGVYEVAAGNERYSFAANPLRREESDLTRCGSGQWGEWQFTGLQAEERSIGSIFLLLALLTFAMHLAISARSVRSNAG
jgi:hypothetical protein